VAYTLLADRVDAYSLAGYTAAAVGRALGYGGDIPDPDKARAEFDAALAAAPVLLDSDQHVLLSAIGLGG
jgi:hypothetical protein